jgi:hypothetical protein
MPGGFLLLAFSVQANSFRGKIEGFQLASCHQEKCFQIISPLAHISYFDGSYAFDEASLKLSGRTIASRDAYYDKNLKKVFMRNVEGVDYVYNIVSGELLQYGK